MNWIDRNFSSDDVFIQVVILASFKEYTIFNLKIWMDDFFFNRKCSVKVKIHVEKINIHIEAFQNFQYNILLLRIYPFKLSNFEEITVQHGWESQKKLRNIDSINITSFSAVSIVWNWKEFTGNWSTFFSYPYIKFNSLASQEIILHNHFKMYPDQLNKQPIE